MSVEFTCEGLLIDGELLPVYSGSVHYWRLEKRLWSGILDNVRNMGFKAVETYIPWAVHEVEEGRFDFGQFSENNDLDAFLSLCEEKGLKIFVRPGPHINAELTLYGYPERVLNDADIQAKSPWGTKVVFPHFPKPFPVPSYASEKLYMETGKYFDVLAPILRKHQHPYGGVVAVQADNETCYFFQCKAYTMDYSDDSVKLYRKILGEKYKSIEDLNKAYHSTYEGFDSIGPPRGFAGRKKEDLPYYFDWVEYKEYQVLYALKRLARMWRDRGLQIPVYHNSAGHFYTPVDMVGTEQSQEIALEGIDVYYSQNDISERVRYAAGTSILPFCPEFGCGINYDSPCGYQPEDIEFCTFYAIMLGMKAVNFYMLVERDRWTGSPITADNGIRERHFELFKRLNRFLEDEQFHKFSRKPGVLVMRNYDFTRFRQLYSIMDASLFYCNCILKGPVFPASLFKPDVDLGFKHRESDDGYNGLDLYVGYERDNWIEGVSKKLLGGNVDFNYSDTHLPLERMLEYPVILASTYDFMDEHEMKKLMDYVRQGGKLVIGPVVPYLNMKMEECRLLDSLFSDENTGIRVDAGARSEVEIQLGKGCIILMKDTDELDIEKLGLKTEYSTNNFNIELSLHENQGRLFLFAANKSLEEQLARLSFDGIKTLRAKWNATDLKGHGSVALTMKPRTVSVWEVF